MRFFDWAKKCQETHQHCMLDRPAFCLAAKSLAKKALPFVWARRSIDCYCFWFVVQGYLVRYSRPLRLPGCKLWLDMLIKRTNGID